MQNRSLQMLQGNPASAYKHAQDLRKISKFLDGRARNAASSNKEPFRGMRLTHQFDSYAIKSNNSHC